MRTREVWWYFTISSLLFCVKCTKRAIDDDYYNNVICFDGSQTQQEGEQAENVIRSEKTRNSVASTESQLASTSNQTISYSNISQRNLTFQRSILIQLLNQQSSSQTSLSQGQEFPVHKTEQPPTKRGREDSSCNTCYGEFDLWNDEVTHFTFKMKFGLQKLSPSRFSYSSNDLKFALFFDFVLETTKYSIERLQADENIYRLVCTLFKIIDLQEADLKPYYYLFSSYSSHDIFRSTCQSIPIYLFFTAVSLIMQEKNERIRSTLSPIIENTFSQSVQILSSQYWKKLFDELSKEYKLKFDPKPTQTCGFDIPTVNFIYHEMKKSCNPKVKDFFKRVWYKGINRSSKFHSIEIKINTVTFKLAPLFEETRIKYFKKAARKVYQIQFLKLLLKQHLSFNNLIEDYKLLKDEFTSDVIDFRLRLLNQYEFEELTHALHHICELIERTERTAIELAWIKRFHEELNLFLSYKCFIFTYDFYNAVIDSKYLHSSIVFYRPVFGTFKKISTLFSSIQAAFHSKKISVHSNKLGCKLVGVSDDALLLDEIFDQFSELTKLNEEGKSYEATVKFFEIGKKIKRIEYFDINLSLITKNASRFRYVEAIGEIEKIISERNEERVEKIFCSPEYSFLRELWKHSGINIRNKSTEIKMEFLEYFYSFLILNHQ